MATVVPPRPPNCFILFRVDLLPRIEIYKEAANKGTEKIKENEKKNGEEKAQEEKKNAEEKVEEKKKKKEANRQKLAADSKLAGKVWRSAPEEVKSYWEAQADIIKLAHKARHPGYVYRPKKKVEKEELRLQQKVQKEPRKEGKRLEKNTHRVGQGRGPNGGTSEKAKKASLNQPYIVPSRNQRLGTPSMSTVSSSSYRSSLTTTSSSSASASSSATSFVVSMPAFDPYPVVAEDIYSMPHSVPAPLPTVPPNFLVPVPAVFQAPVASVAPLQESMMELLMDDFDPTASFAQPNGQIEIVTGNQQPYHWYPPMVEPALANFDAVTMSTPPAGHLQVVNGNQMNAVPLTNPFQPAVAPVSPVVRATRPSEVRVPLNMNNIFDFRDIYDDCLRTVTEADIDAAF